ncbi:TauD/TfdA dioxygenase family protein [Aspergillus undulatus]|uniref:TauD/TfdA dioxygenase family protein n=1 Tax=Aspergillus undulatus TaxID=1810928 RepID=UPI003CCDC01B
MRAGNDAALSGLYKTPTLLNPSPSTRQTPSKSASGSRFSSVGSLKDVENFDVTPVIGREFSSVSLVEWIPLPMVLTLAVSQRGVKELVDRLGSLSGKPSTSRLHIHPISNSSREHSTPDDEISVISSAQRQKLYQSKSSFGRSGKHEWHSDITFEPVPTDYTLLRLTGLPETGGDPLWASGYEVYDRISKPYQAFLDNLKATYAQPRFNLIADQNQFKIHRAIHPVVRTNPVTGWKSIFAIGYHVEKVNNLSEGESRHLLGWFVRLVTENHDLQVRFRWQNPNDLAIWNNGSVYHAATFDYQHLGPRTGHRAVGLGERPYFDSESKSRREALGLN